MAVRGVALKLAVVATALLLLSQVASAQGPPPWTDDWLGLGLELAEQSSMFGSFTLSLGLVHGMFVHLMIDDETGTITELAVNKPSGLIAVFDRVAVYPEMTGMAEVDGPLFSFTSDAVRISLHNNPTLGLVHTAVGTDITVSYFLADGVSAIVEGGSVYISVGEVRARIALLGDGSVSLSADNAVLLELDPGASGAVRVMLVDEEGPLGSVQQCVIEEAFGLGRVGFESFMIALDGIVLSDDVAYAPVSMSAEILKRGSVRIMVSSELASGCALVLNMNSEVLGDDIRPPLTVTIDGMPVAATSSVDEVFAVDSAAHHLISDERGMLLVVYVPAFSTRTLLISSQELLPLLPNDIVGYVAVLSSILLVACAAYFAVRRKREIW